MIALRTAVGLMLLGAVLALTGATWVGLDQGGQRSMLVTVGAVALALLGLDYVDERRTRR